MIYLFKSSKNSRGIPWTSMGWDSARTFKLCQRLDCAHRRRHGRGRGKSAGANDKDQKKKKETPTESMEKLEHEDELRVQHLHGLCHYEIYPINRWHWPSLGDDSVFDDLRMSKKDCPQVLTTWRQRGFQYQYCQSDWSILLLINVSEYWRVLAIQGGNVNASDAPLSKTVPNRGYMHLM